MLNSAYKHTSAENHSEDRPISEQDPNVHRKFTNAHLYRHFGGSRDSFGRQEVYLESNKRPSVLSRWLGGIMQTLGRWSGNETKETKGYIRRHGS